MYAIRSYYEFQIFSLGEGKELLAGFMLFQQGAGGDVVDTGGDRNLHLKSSPLGFVFFARCALGSGAGADELEPGIFDRVDELV